MTDKGHLFGLRTLQHKVRVIAMEMDKEGVTMIGAHRSPRPSAEARPDRDPGSDQTRQLAKLEQWALKPDEVVRDVLPLCSFPRDRRTVG